MNYRLVDKVFSIIGCNFNFNLIWNKHTVELVKVDVTDAEKGKFVSLLHLLIGIKYHVLGLVLKKNPADLVSADFNRTNLAMAEPTRSGWTPLMWKII